MCCCSLRLNFVQLVVVFFGSNVPFVSFLKFFDFNVFRSNTAPTCIAPFSPLTLMLTGVWVPLLCLGLLLFTLALHYGAWHIVHNNDCACCGACCAPKDGGGGGGAADVGPPALHSAGSLQPHPTALHHYHHHNHGGRCNMCLRACLECCARAEGAHHITSAEPFSFSPYYRSFIALTLFSYNSITSVVILYFDCQAVGDDHLLAAYPAIVSLSRRVDHLASMRTHSVCVTLWSFVVVV